MSHEDGGVGDWRSLDGVARAYGQCYNVGLGHRGCVTAQGNIHVKWWLTVEIGGLCEIYNGDQEAMGWWFAIQRL